MIVDELATALGVLLLILLPVAVLVMVIIAFARSQRIIQLEKRMVHLESLVRQLFETRLQEQDSASDGESVQRAEGKRDAAEPPPATVQAKLAAAPRERREPIAWELLVGKRALGWVAVLLLIFAAAFFIRYAIDNDWIGPLGQVTLAEIGGLILVIAGWCFARRQWRRFSQMLSAAGVVVLYLATYAAFGFYQLLSRDVASAFLIVILIESMLLALVYDALAIALTAVLGGLLIPVLMHSTHDQYPAFFTYLAALNLAVVVLLSARPWAAIGSVAMIGTQGLFWIWYAGNYHPEKIAWALGFQAVVYGLYLAHNLAIHWMPRRRAVSEDLLRLVLAPAFWFAAFYVVLRDDSVSWQRADPWMGTTAIVMAVLYAVIARVMLASSARSSAQVVTALAISVGFIALAFPLQADAAWVALGWSAEGAVLWWFGQRISHGQLRAIGGGLCLAAMARLVVHDLPPGVREPFVPIFNRFALPAIGVALCVIGGLVSTRRYLARRSVTERAMAGIGGGFSVLLLWGVLSLDCYDYFESLSTRPDAPRERLLWLGQMALSVLWAAYATAVLVTGFQADRAWLRWMALALYGATVLKVFLVDIQELDELYRIVAFFVLAIFMGLAAWGYQRISLPASSGESES